MSDATKEQVKPKGTGREITPLVVVDLNRKYSYIFPETIWDAYQLVKNAAFYTATLTMKDEDRIAGTISREDVIAKMTRDVEARTAEGVKRYGEPLRAFNGRDARLDLYQELLDALQYFRQVIEEAEVTR